LSFYYHKVVLALRNVSLSYLGPVSARYFLSKASVFLFPLDALTILIPLTNSSNAALMIRLPPTAIGLGRREIWEFDNRRQSRKDAEIAESDRQLANLAVGGQHKTRFVEKALRRRDFHHKETLVLPFEAGYDGSLRSTDINTASLSESFRASGHFDSEDYQGLIRDFSIGEDHCGIIDGVQEGDGEGLLTTLVASPESRAQSIVKSSLPRDEIHYGGFVESPNSFLQSSSGLISPLGKFNYYTYLLDSTADWTVPSDISTPQAVPLPSAQRLRIKLPLPRSPLFISHNVFSPPERLPTSGLTSHVDSQVALHNTPGIIFAEPARRPPRRSPQTFRHQSNSFSFDSSERASAAYQQERLVSTSTINSTHGLSNEPNLHQELQGSSLQSSRATSGVSPVLFRKISAEADSSLQNIEDEALLQPISNDSSPRMPPPYSAVSRNISSAGSLHSPQGYIPKNPITSPIRPEWTPTHNKDDRVSSSPKSTQVSGKGREKPATKHSVSLKL
jgi:hypothetical protein